MVMEVKPDQTTYACEICGHVFITKQFARECKCRYSQMNEAVSNYAVIEED